MSSRRAAMLCGLRSLRRSRVRHSFFWFATGSQVRKIAWTVLEGDLQCLWGVATSCSFFGVRQSRHGQVWLSPDQQRRIPTWFMPNLSFFLFPFWTLSSFDWLPDSFGEVKSASMSTAVTYSLDISTCWSGRRALACTSWSVTTSQQSWLWGLRCFPVMYLCVHHVILDLFSEISNHDVVHYGGHRHNTDQNGPLIAPNTQTGRWRVMLKSSGKVEIASLRCLDKRSARERLWRKGLFWNSHVNVTRMDTSVCSGSGGPRT